MTREELKNLLVEEEDLSGLSIYIWGTGNTSKLYVEGLKRIEKDGFFVSGYVDNNSQKWGTEFAGKKVFSPSDILKIPAVLILIATPRRQTFTEIVGQLNDLGIKWRHIDDYLFKRYASSVIECYDLFEDERSREVYAELIRCRMKCEYPDDRFIDKDQYFSFADFSEYNEQEIFVDCGAYVGDSLEKYIWNKDGVFKRIHAFEPDKKNIAAMQYRCERLKKEWNLEENRIIIHPYGVSDKSEAYSIERYSENNGFGSKIVPRDGSGSENEECKVVAIDDVISEPIGFIKADIESFEYRMLLGAGNSIKNYMPRLAICTYHNAVDFFSIPGLIHSLNSQYRLSFRHYTHLLSESVVYAYKVNEKSK